VIGIGIIGFGGWGANLARNFCAAGARLAAVCDRQADRLAEAGHRYGLIRLTPDWGDLVGDPRIAAVVVATPPSIHFEIAHACLLAGKHVFVEKPMTFSSDQARRLLDTSQKKNLTLMVDHTFVYAKPVETILEMAADGILGSLVSYDGARLSPPPANSDMGVVWDLAVHDVALMSHISRQNPVAVSALRVGGADGRAPREVRLMVQFDGGFVGQAHVSWNSPKKVRLVRVEGRKGALVYDEMEPIEKLKLYETDQASSGEPCIIPSQNMSDGETLESVARAFLQSVATGIPPLTDGVAGLRAVEVLEAAEASLAQGGRMLRLPQMGAYFRKSRSTAEPRPVRPEMPANRTESSAANR
jgi:predicted dehydrogenase